MRNLTSTGAYGKEMKNSNVYVVYMYQRWTENISDRREVGINLLTTNQVLDFLLRTWSLTVRFSSSKILTCFFLKKIIHFTILLFNKKWLHPHNGNF